MQPRYTQSTTPVQDWYGNHAQSVQQQQQQKWAGGAAAAKPAGSWGLLPHQETARPNTGILPNPGYIPPQYPTWGAPQWPGNPPAASYPPLQGQSNAFVPPLMSAERPPLHPFSPTMPMYVEPGKTTGTKNVSEPGGFVGMIQQPVYRAILVNSISMPAVVLKKVKGLKKKKAPKRRLSTELTEDERWYCSRGCGKFYRKSSTISIKTHNAMCTFVKKPEPTTTTPTPTVTEPTATPAGTGTEAKAEQPAATTEETIAVTSTTETEKPNLSNNEVTSPDKSAILPEEELLKIETNETQEAAAVPAAESTSGTRIPPALSAEQDDSKAEETAPMAEAE